MSCDRTKSDFEEKNMRCSNCGTENSERNLNCSNCGADLFNEEKKNIFKNKKFLISVSSVFVLIIIGFVIVINSVVIPNQAADKMHKAFESKTGVNVINVFEEYCGNYSVVYDNLTKSGKAVFTEFESCIDNAKEKLNSQPVETDINKYLLETMGDIVLPQEYSAITTIGEYNVELNDIVADYYNLYNSKIAYKKGVELYNKNDFSGAINSFLKVTKEDNWYDDAQNKLTESRKKLLEEKMKKIEKYIADGDYESAQSVINELRSEELTDEISKKLDEYETKIYESKLAKIDEYVNSGDMEAAKAYIESLGDGLSSEAQARLNQAIKNKANDYIAKADDALKSGERQGAYDMALMAQNLCPDDDEVNKKVEYFKAYLPFALYKEENYLSQKQGESYWMNLIYYNRKCTSNDSKTMRHCVYVAYDSVDVSSSSLLRTVTYNLGKKYDIVSGTEFIPYYSRSREQKGYFEIYGDGKKIFTSNILGVNFLPKDFSINVENVDMLTIKYYGDTKYRSLDLDTVAYGISNFVATKNLPK